MSGTSTDAVDGVLADLSAPSIQLLAQASLPLPPALRDELLALNTPGADELHRAAMAANALADCQAAVVQSLLAQAGLSARQVQVLGTHGQTVRHAPENGYTVQINAPARLAERCGIATVADFRSRDVAAGGQGAPLVPAFHAAYFGTDARRAVLNLGGIANLTVLESPVRGFDTGPANMLMDAWAQAHLGEPFDLDGRWAARGHCQPALLASLLADPWFARVPPKSTGRDLFSLAWLHSHLDRPGPQGARCAPADVQATLLELSVRSIADALQRHAAGVQEILACGGGALNPVLMARLRDALAPVRLRTTADEGVPVQAVEALAFAWLAHAWLQGQATGLPEVTGARHATVAGCLYPA